MKQSTPAGAGHRGYENNTESTVMSSNTAGLGEARNNKCGPGTPVICTRHKAPEVQFKLPWFPYLPSHKLYSVLTGRKSLWDLARLTRRICVSPGSSKLNVSLPGKVLPGKGPNEGNKREVLPSSLRKF